MQSVDQNKIPPEVKVPRLLIVALLSPIILGSVSWFLVTELSRPPPPASGVCIPCYFVGLLIIFLLSCFLVYLAIYSASTAVRSCGKQSHSNVFLLSAFALILNVTALIPPARPLVMHYLDRWQLSAQQNANAKQLLAQQVAISKGAAQCQIQRGVLSKTWAARHRDFIEEVRQYYATSKSFKVDELGLNGTGLQQPTRAASFKLDNFFERCKGRPACEDFILPDSTRDAEDPDGNTFEIYVDSEKEFSINGDRVSIDDPHVLMHFNNLEYEAWPCVSAKKFSVRFRLDTGA